VRDTAETLAAFIDPDGAEPNGRNQHHQRSCTPGQTLADGMTPARILLTPEHLAVITELLESQRRSGLLIRVVHVAASDLEARPGQGWTSGVLAAIPIPVIERQACTGGVRLLVTNDDGEALHLGRSKRLFSAA
jgi:hypothetical protein